MNEIIQQSLEILELIFNKTILIASIVLGVFLSAIGYPKEIVVFVISLVTIDLFTKQYSLVKKEYKEFTLHRYFQAWGQRILTSRALKNGICVKVFLYTPVLYIANKCSIIPEMVGGEVVSSMLYTLLILVETSSIFENFIDAGDTSAMPFLKYIKKKEQEILGDENKEK